MSQASVAGAVANIRRWGRPLRLYPLGADQWAQVERDLQRRAARFVMLEIGSSVADALDADLADALWDADLAGEPDDAGRPGATLIVLTDTAMAEVWDCYTVPLSADASARLVESLAGQAVRVAEDWNVKPPPE